MWFNKRRTETDMWEYKYEITADQIEPRYNHLHHSDALRFLERGRLDMLKEIGHATESLMAKNLFLVITEIRVKYKRELIAGEIYVQCTEARIESRLIVVEQQILTEQRKTAVSAVVSSCFISGDSRRIVSPPEWFATAFTDAATA